MRIAGMELNPEHQALEIFVSGCLRNCKGCHNPELQSFGNGKKWQRWMRDNEGKLKDGWHTLADKLWIVGGDLLCQPLHEAVEFLKALRRIGHYTIWVWTGEDSLERIDQSIRENCDYIKYGHYDHVLLPIEIDYGGPQLLRLASNNQRLQKCEGHSND